MRDSNNGVQRTLHKVSGPLTPDVRQIKMNEQNQSTTEWKLDGRLPDGPYWELTGRSSVRQVFDAVYNYFPKGTSLIIDQSWPTPEVSVILEALASSFAPSDISWKAVRYAIPLGLEMPQELKHLVETHAGPEYCTDAFVIRGDSALLLWYDFPEEPIVIHPGIPETTIKSFAEHAGLKIGQRK